MTSNVLPFFWHLASSSKDTRLSASADLVSSLETFQSTYLENKPETNGEEDEVDEEDESDEESGEEVDASDEENDAIDMEEARRLDKKLGASNAEDVVYSVKRLVRGLASSRESSRLGFAVALTELLSRIQTVSASQVLSLLLRSAPVGLTMKGPEARDALFAQLFGINAIIQSKCLFAANSSLDTFQKVIGQLVHLGTTKGWMRESAWWAILGATEGVLNSNVSWKNKAVDGLVKQIYEEKNWSQEKVALTLLLERQKPDLNWKALFQPTFKHTPLLNSQNLHIIARLLKDSDMTDEEEGNKLSTSTGSWKPQLHFVWNTIFDTYFPAAPTSGADANRASFQDFFRTVVDESLFSNSSSSERKFWGFSVLARALPLMPAEQLPLLFTPNVMRNWTSELASSERYLHKSALNLAKQVQDTVKENPTVGFAVLSALLKGKGDFDKVTKTKTVENIMNSLSEEGVKQYVAYLQGIVLGGEEKNGTDNSGLEERRQWAFDQLASLFRNNKVPKDDELISIILDFLLVHAFFIIRKTDKKSNLAALRTAPKPALSEATAAVCRTRFFTCLVDVTIAQPSSKEGRTSRQGCDSTNRLWLRRAIDSLIALEADSKHVELMLDADEEIKTLRKDAVATLARLDKLKNKEENVVRGVEILLAFSLLQTYDESEDALELLEDVNSSAKRMFNLTSSKAATEEEEHPPIDALLDVLIALLEKGSAGLKELGKLVVGMVGSAFTVSSVEHLVAQLEQTAPETIETNDDEDVEDDDEMEDKAVEEEDEAESESDDEDEEESEEEEEDDANLKVDPEFRRRVAEALQVSGMGVDDDAEGDSDDESDEEVWDDDKMMQVDEQLAEVFRQRANAGKSSDFKHLHIQSVHFKTRILDFFDVFARKQLDNPTILHIMVPLLRLVSSASITEKDLSNKAAGILRSRLNQPKEVPTTADEETCKSVIDQIHAFARRAPTNDFSNLCSICSVFVFRTLDASAPKSSVGIDAYRETLTDYMNRKTSLVHPAFILNLIRRYPVRTFALTTDLLKHASGKDVKKVYNQVQSFTFLTVYSQQLATLSKSLDRADLVAFVSSSVDIVYNILEASPTSGKEWDAGKLREVAKYAVHLARTSKNALGEGIVAEAWDAQRLEGITESVAVGERTGIMKGLQGDLKQLKAILAGSKKNKEEKQSKKLKGKKAQAEVADEDKMDVDEVEPEQAVAADGVKEKKVKKSKEDKADKTGEEATKKRKSKGDKTKESKKVKVDA